MRRGTRVRAFLSKPIPRPPRVVFVAAAIVLGVATTVAVAWLLAYFVDGGQGVGRGRRGFRMDVALQPITAPLEVIPGTDGYSMDGDVLIPPAPPVNTEVWIQQVTRYRRWGTDIVEVWGPVSGPYSYGSLHALVEGTSFEAEMNQKFDRGEEETAWWRADGWPLTALSAEARWRRWDSLGVERVVGGVLVGSRHVLPDDGVSMLPLQPIWNGLVIDTAFYSSLWFALFSLGSVRCILRRRRGLCVHCGYKLLPEQGRCSECGKDVLNRAKSLVSKPASASS